MHRPPVRLALPLVAVGSALVASVVGCISDTDKPGAPLLDDVRARTSLDTLVVTGTAEYNATVTVSGGVNDVAAIADARTGHFEVPVPLAPGSNALSVTAKDAVGNVSDPATTTVIHDPARAEVVHVSLPRTVVSADDGNLEVIVDIANDEPEIALQTLGVTLTIPEDAGFAPLPIAVNDTGHAVVVLSERRAIGTYTIKVEADVADLDGNKAFDQAGFSVTPGRPATVDVTLSATVNSAAIGPAAEISVPADTEVDVAVTVKDAYDNLVTGAPIRIDAPGSGATVLADHLVGLTTAGTFDVVADTGSDLISGTAHLTITAAAPDHVELSADAALVEAGSAVHAVARVVDAFGNTVADAVPDISVNAPQEFGAPLVDAGVATATATVTAAGSYTITASDPASAATPATASLVVVAATPSTLNFEIDPSGLPYLAGQSVRATYALLDAFGNVNSSTPLVVTVNAPNVSVADDGLGHVEINGIVRAGSYIVRAHAVGTALADDLETVVIDPDPQLAGFNLVLSSSLIAQFGSVVFAATDGFGNSIDVAGITTRVTPSTNTTVSGNTITFTEPGSYTIQSCVTGSATLCDTEFISVQGLLDTVPPTVSVVIETPTGITNVVRGQRIVFRVDLTDDRALSSLSFVATFGNNGTCRATGGPILYDGTTSESSTFSFTVPTCAIPLDVVSIVAQASDQAGNTHNVANETLSITDPFQLSFPASTAQQRFLNTVVGFASSINGPTGVAADPLGGTVYVANGANGNNTNRAIGVTIDRVQFTLVDQNNQRFDLRGVRSAAASRATNLFFGVQEVNNGGGGSSGIVRITSDLQRQIFVSSTTPGNQTEAITANQSSVEQLVLSEIAAPLTQPTALCMVISVQDHIWCYGNVDDTAGNATKLAEVEINGLRPRGIAIDGPDNGADLDVLFAALDNNTHVIRPFTFNADRTTLTAGTDIDISAFVNGAGQLGDLAVGPQPNENLYLVHRSQGRVLKIDRSTTPPTVSVFVSGLTSPSGLAFDGNSMLITDTNDNVVFRVIPDPAAPGIF